MGQLPARSDYQRSEAAPKPAFSASWAIHLLVSCSPAPAGNPVGAGAARRQRPQQTRPKRSHSAAPNRRQQHKVGAVERGPARQMTGRIAAVSVDAVAALPAGQGAHTDRHGSLAILLTAEPGSELAPASIPLREGAAKGGIGGPGDDAHRCILGDDWTDCHAPSRAFAHSRRPSHTSGRSVCRRHRIRRDAAAGPADGRAPPGPHQARRQQGR